MIHKGMLVLSGILTAFMLVVGGALAGSLLSPSDEIEDPSQETESAVSPLEDPQVITIFQEREQAYQELIDEANQKLIEAYQAQEALAGRLESEEEGVGSGEYAVSPELAVGLALSVAPSAKTVKRVELVLFQGTPAYEVVLDRGTVYIGAENGWLLHNGAISSSSGGGGGGFEDHQDHEDDHNDEHEDDD